MVDVTPKGLPYGENQRAAERQAAAGLPQSISSPASPTVEGAPAPRRSPVRPGATMRQTDDPLRVLNPATPIAMAPTPSQQFQQIADRSANPMIRLIAMRLADDQS